MGFGKNITLSKSYSSETRSLWAKITFSNGQYTHFFFWTTGRNPHTWHNITNDHQPGLFFPFRKKLQPHFTTNPPLSGSLTSNQGSQCHSKRHTCAQIKVSPLTSCAQTQLSLKCPSKALYRFLRQPSRAWGEQGESLSSGGRKREEHVSHRTPPTDWQTQLLSLHPPLVSSVPWTRIYHPERMERDEEKIHKQQIVNRCNFNLGSSDLCWWSDKELILKETALCDHNCSVPGREDPLGVNNSPVLRQGFEGGGETCP